MTAQHELDQERDMRMTVQQELDEEKDKKNKLQHAHDVAIACHSQLCSTSVSYNRERTGSNQLFGFCGFSFRTQP